MSLYLVVLPFALMVVAVIVELVLSLSWNRFYYTHGIRILTRQLGLSASVAVLPDGRELQRQYRTSRLGIFLLRSLDDRHLAFRERMLTSEINRFIHKPVMNGLLVLDPDGATVTLLGHLHWNVIVSAIMLLIVSALFSVTVFWFVPIIFVLIGVLQFRRSFIVQKQRFIALAEAVVATVSEGSDRVSTPGATESIAG